MIDKLAFQAGLVLQHVTTVQLTINYNIEFLLLCVTGPLHVPIVPGIDGLQTHNPKQGTISFPSQLYQHH